MGCRLRRHWSMVAGNDAMVMFLTGGDCVSTAAVETAAFRRWQLDFPASGRGAGRVPALAAVVHDDVTTGVDHRRLA